MLIFSVKHRITIFYLFCNFANNRSIIAFVRVLSLKKSKWPPWRHRFWNFKIWERWTLQISIRSFLENFIKIASSVWAVKMTQIDWQTDIQTDRHTYSHTDTLGQSQHIYCPPNASSSLQCYLRQKLWLDRYESSADKSNANVGVAILLITRCITVLTNKSCDFFDVCHLIKILFTSCLCVSHCSCVVLLHMKYDKYRS